MMGRGMGTKASFRLIPLPIIPLPRLRRSGFGLRRHGYDGQDGGQASSFGATWCAHWTILAQRGESVQPMVGTFFITRNPCKHWSKRAPGATLSSMFPGKRPQNRPKTAEREPSAFLRQLPAKRNKCLFPRLVPFTFKKAGQLTNRAKNPEIPGCGAAH